MAVYRYQYEREVYEKPSHRKIELVAIDRPKIPLVFKNGNKSTFPVKILVDSGADNIVLGVDIANFLEVDLSKAEKVNTNVVGGDTIITLKTKIEVIFQGKTFKTTVDFSEGHNMPLVGREFFEFFVSVTFRQKAKIVELELASGSN